MASAQDDEKAMLASMGQGDPAQAARLLSFFYDELKILARRQMGGESPGHTLQTTGLVHEAFLKLADHKIGWKDRAHFFSGAAKAMRQILVDHARSKGRLKRGGGWNRKMFDEAVDHSPGGPAGNPDLYEALVKLAAEHEREARVVELKFFAGLSVKETAALLDVATRTVEMDWRMAKAWLKRELRRGGSSA